MDVENEKLSRHEMDHKPWKYIGYKGFARYSSLSNDFFAVRRYDRTHCRVLLAKQDRIAKLEEDLDCLDNELSSRTAFDKDNGTLRNDESKERKKLLADLGEELRSYDELLLHFLNLKSKRIAPNRIVNNIRTWLSNNNQPIALNEVEFLQADDLITVAASRKSPVRQCFEWALVLSRGLYGCFLHKEDADTAAITHSTVYGKDERVDFVASISAAIASFIILVAPLWALYRLENTWETLLVITFFVAVLLLYLALATLARPFEILAAGAGYSAVLVMFLQIGTGPDIHRGP
ncbi:hypothetical protein SCAR479_08051 [Seiridium cardinale]|uniref:DUF6594 domain-containing protein n=1 Tax=Seiridium cardinale TaxID=138064 RepID=A0ABR2XP20_9PEZI